MASAREEFLQKLKTQLDDLNERWQIERERLETLARNTSADARKTVESQIEELREKRREMKEKIVDLEVAGENAWEELREGAEQAWKALTEALKKASSHFK